MTKEEYRALRLSMGLSQAKLAKLLKKSVSAIEKREAGESSIDYEAAVAIKTLNFIHKHKARFKCVERREILD